MVCCLFLPNAVSPIVFDLKSIKVIMPKIWCTRSLLFHLPFSIFRVKFLRVFVNKHNNPRLGIRRRYLSPRQWIETLVSEQWQTIKLLSKHNFPIFSDQITWRDDRSNEPNPSLILDRFLFFLSGGYFKHKKTVRLCVAFFSRNEDFLN